MAKVVEAWGEVKSVQEWLLDKRCHPEVTYDSLRKRLGRGGEFSIPEIAITYPVIKGAQQGDTKERIRNRNLKARERYKGFVLAQKVRERHAAGVERSEIRERFDITEGTLQKIISGQMYFNWAWDQCKPGEAPEHFKDLKHECEHVEGSTEGLEVYLEDL